MTLEGVLCLEANSKITILKDFIFRTTKRNALNFIGNSAQYGGAVYVDDESNFGSCVSNPFEIKSPKLECFISIVSTQTVVTDNSNFSLSNIIFDKNSAAASGSTLFGGLATSVARFTDLSRIYGFLNHR